MSEPDYRKEMQLPTGKTCADCAHVRRCTAFGYTTATDTACDFWPSRYREVATPNEVIGLEVTAYMRDDVKANPEGEG